MRAYWDAYREAMLRLESLEQALLPEDYRRELPASAEDIEKEGRWDSLTRVARELRDQDVERYMRWRAKRAADKLVERYVQLDAWGRTRIADAYARFFEEEGRKFLEERPTWESPAVPIDQRSALYAKYREAYEERLRAQNSIAAGLLMKQLPDVDWTQASFALPVP